MAERYDSTAAAHYAAYRPPLHQIILGRVLSDEAPFDVGLDVGCGTGYSAVALAEHCVRVYGIDPSPSMLSAATAHERVTYLEGTAERIPLPTHSVGVATFAGSLFYADADATLEEIRRVCRDGAVVVPYDFEVLLDDVLRQCGIEPQADRSGYDHGANFSDAPGLTELAAGRERASVQVTASELAHVLLSDSHRFDHFVTRYGAPDPFPALVGELRSAYDQATIEADLYYSKYTIEAA